MSVLGDDLVAYEQAADAAARQQALHAWLSDATDILERARAAITTLEDLERVTETALRALARLEAKLLGRGVVWSPDRLRELAERGDT